MKVRNHKEFALFNYSSTTSKKHSLGDIVLKEVIEETQAIIEVGVIIQIHEEEEYRTDMFGNCSLCEIRLATLDEVTKYRPELLVKIKRDLKNCEPMKTKINNTEKFFPNGNKSWQETFFEVVSAISLQLVKDKIESKVISKIHEAHGSCGLYQLAEELTDKFETIYEGRFWDGDWLETIEKYISSELA